MIRCLRCSHGRDAYDRKNPFHPPPTTSSLFRGPLVGDDETSAHYIFLRVS